MTFLHGELQWSERLFVELATIRQIYRMGALRVRQSRWSVSRQATNEGVNLFGFARTDIGLSRPLFAAAHLLKSANIPFCVLDIPHRGADAPPEWLAPYLSHKPLFSASLHFYNPPHFPLAMSTYGRQAFEGRRNVAYWFWELPSAPRSWKWIGRYFDELWVATSSVGQSFCDFGLPIRKVPLGLFLESTPLSSRRRLRLPEDEFLVFSSFDVRSLPQRKNPFGAIDAFQRAFQGKSGARLVLKGYDSSGSALPKVYQKKIESLGDQVISITQRLDREDMLKLLASCDVFLSLHRAEGLGLPQLEALSLGVPAVVTGCPVMREFSPWEGLYMVACSPRSVGLGEFVYGHGQHWFEPDIDHAASLLSGLYESRAHVQVGFEKAHFDPDVFLCAIRSILVGC